MSKQYFLLQQLFEFHRACKQKHFCLAKIGYQQECQTVTIAATGTPVTSCLAKKFNKQNFLL